MRYAICLVPNVLLLVVLLRMTYVGLHAQRAAIFFFLSAWLAYSVATLFLAQLVPVTSRQYAWVFLAASAAIWLCGAPALFAAARRIGGLWHGAVIAAVLASAALASRYALLDSSMLTIAKCLALNCWAAVILGTIFALAAKNAEQPDRLLWGCVGAFFLIYGFGYLAIGAMRAPAWSYPVLIVAAALAWFVLALFVRPTREHIFNPEKLGLTSAAYFQRAATTSSFDRRAARG